MSVTIINFHGVGPAPDKIGAAEQDCWLDKQFFEDLLDRVVGHSHVRLTVDDGNVSDVEVVLPALLHRKLRACFFVCSGRLNRPTFLSRAHIRDLLASGMEIGSHGKNHVSWRHLSSDQLVEELEESRRVLEDVCERPIDHAACPFGEYDRTVLEGLRRARYQRVFTSDGGVATEHDWIQPRTTVRRSMALSDIQRFARQGPGIASQSLIGVRKFLKRLR